MTNDHLSDSRSDLISSEILGNISASDIEYGSAQKPEIESNEGEVIDFPLSSSMSK